jgi:hypothetical protein
MNKEHFDRWQCLTCDDNHELPDRKAAIDHMKLVHGWKEGTLAMKRLIIHLDFAHGCWRSNYDWDFGKFRMLQMTGFSEVSQME